MGTPPSRNRGSARRSSEVSHARLCLKSKVTSEPRTGLPFSILSGRGTLTQSQNSFYNTANTLLTGGELAGLFRFRDTPTGPYSFGKNGSARESDGTRILSCFLEHHEFCSGCGQTLRFEEEIPEVLVASTTA